MKYCQKFVDLPDLMMKILGMNKMINYKKRLHLKILVENVKQRSVRPEDVKQENIDFIYIYYI